jgi:NADH dehydrogenase FAD-containing subunit
VTVALLRRDFHHSELAAGQRAGLVEEDRRHPPRVLEAASIAHEKPAATATFPVDLSDKAARALKRLCVEVRTGVPVTAVQPGAVRLGTELIEAATVLWAAGVAPSAIGRSLGVPVDRAGRVVVNADLTIPGRPEVFVIGDMAVSLDAAGRRLPGLAPVAIQQGEYAARAIVRAVRGGISEPFATATVERWRRSAGRRLSWTSVGSVSRDIPHGCPGGSSTSSGSSGSGTASS